MMNLRNMLIDGENSGVADYSYDSLISELDKDNHYCRNSNYQEKPKAI